MNQKQREIIVEAFIQHKNNGSNHDLAGDYVDTTSFLQELIETDDKLKEMVKEAETEWEES